MSRVYSGNKEFIETYKVSHVISFCGCDCHDIALSSECGLLINDTPDRAEKYFDLIDKHDSKKISDTSGQDEFRYRYVITFDLTENGHCGNVNNIVQNVLQILINKGRSGCIKCLFCKRFFCKECFKGYKKCLNCGLRCDFDTFLYKFLKTIRKCENADEFNRNNVKGSECDNGIIYDKTYHKSFCLEPRSKYTVKQCPLCFLCYCSECYYGICPLKCV